MHAAEEGARIRAALGGVLLEVHHIGSTALPIPAKPLIDLLLVVRDVDPLDARERVDAMESLGYEAWGEYGIAGRRLFTKVDRSFRDGDEIDDPGQRSHNVHAFTRGAGAITRHLDFRDYMLAHPAEAARYGALKVELAAKHPRDLDAYMSGKDAFIKEMEKRAAAWRHRTS